MKSWIIVLLLSLVSMSAFAHKHHGTDIPVGELTAAQLLEQQDKFSAQYKKFTPEQADLTAIKTLAGKDVVVLFGTWCHDSQREVPRFLKLIDHAKVQLGSLKLIALDFKKQDPNGMATLHKIKRTPTFVVLQQGKELGRVIERPTESLAVDLAKISQQEKSDKSQ